MGLAAAKQLPLPRSAKRKLPMIFYEAGSGLVASHSCTQPRFLHNTRTYSIGILVSWYNNTLTTLGASMSSYIFEIFFLITLLYVQQSRVGHSHPNRDCWTDSSVICPLAWGSGGNVHGNIVSGLLHEIVSVGAIKVWG